MKFRTLKAMLASIALLASGSAVADFGAGVKAGTLGIGLEGRWDPPVPWFDLRVGLNRYDYSDNGDYAGKISPEGKFFAIREARAEIAQELQTLAADPLAALTAHGHQTGSCSCCGRLLTNEESVRLGIGPVCRVRWGL